MVVAVCCRLTNNQFSVAEIEAIVEEAENAGTYVSSHRRRTHDHRNIWDIGTYHSGCLYHFVLKSKLAAMNEFKLINNYLVRRNVKSSDVMYRLMQVCAHAYMPRAIDRAVRAGVRRSVAVREICLFSNIRMYGHRACLTCGPRYTQGAEQAPRSSISYGLYHNSTTLHNVIMSQLPVTCGGPHHHSAS